MPIVNGINLDEYDFGNASTPDSLSSSPKQTVNGIDLSKYDFGEETQKTPSAPSPEETPEASFLRRIPDLGVSLLKGAVGLPEAVVGLLDIPTMGYAGKGAEALGIRFKETQEILDSLYSPQQQEANRKVAEAKGFTSTIGTAFENPSTILQMVAESAPSMIGAGGIGRGLIKFFPKLAPVIAGAAGEGLISGGQTAEQIRQGEESGLLSSGQAGIAGLSGMLTGILGVVGGKLAKRLGIVDVDTLIAGGSVRAAVDDATAVAKKNVLRKMIESAISEGAFEELPQSLQEKMAQNIATGKPATEGVAEAGAMGMLTGGVMGAFGGAGGHVLSGMEILQKDKENQDRSQEIQTFVANKGYADLSNNDLLQAYTESDAVQKELPDDTNLSASMAVMKSELEKRGVWPEDKLSRDIESKMAELDEKLGNPVQESSEAVMQTERGEPNVEGQLQAEAERQVTPTEPILQPGEDIENAPPMADTSQMIASSPPSSFFSMPNITTEQKAEEKASPTLPLTELSEEGTANPPSTPEKTSQEVTEEKVGEVRTSDNLVPKKGSEFGLKGLNENRWTVDGNIMGNTPEEAVAEYNMVQAIAKEEADQKAVYDTVIPKLRSGDYTEADIKKITPYGKTTTSTKQMDGILMSLGLTHKQAGQARKKAGDVDTTSKGAILYDVGRTVETAREMGLLGEKKKADAPKVQTVGESSEKGVPVKPDFNEMVAEAQRWRGAAFKVDARLTDNKARLAHSKMTTKGDLDAYLMKKFGIDATTARDVSNELTRKNLPHDSTAKVEDFADEPWAKTVAPLKKEKPKSVPKPQKEVTLESHVRKNKVNFNIPGHSNKEAISDGLLSFVKNDAVNADKAAEELQGMGLLGATPDEYATAGDYLYAELQRIVYNRKNKIIQSLTAEEEAAIKEFKEASLNEGYDESDIEAEVREDQRTGKKEAYSIKDSEAHGEAQSILEADEDFVKEEDDFLSIAKKVDAFADGSYSSEDLKEIVDNQTKLDELDAQVPVGTTIRIKTGFGESILHKSSKKEGVYQISRFDTKGEAIGDSEYTDYQKAVKDLRHEQGSAVTAVNTLLPIIEKSKKATPTTELFDTSEMFTLSGNQPVEQKTMKIPEKKGDRLLDVEKQTTDELRDRLSGEKAKREFEEGRLKTSTGQRGGENETGASKTTFGDTTAPVESDRSLGILKGEFEREFGKSLDMGWATQVRVPNVLAEGVEKISKVFGKEVVWLKIADSTPHFNGAVSDQLPDKIFINVESKEPHLFILGHEMLHQMKFQSPDLYSSLLVETKKYMKDRKGIARLPELVREDTYADLVGEAFTSEDYWNHLQKKNPTLFEKAIQIAKDIIDKAVKALGIRNVLSPQYFSDVKKAQTIIADIMDEYAQETGVNLSVGTVPKGSILSSKDRQALVTDILNILSEGSTINFVGTIDPNRADIQKALTEWKKGNPDSAFTIEGMHRKVVVDGNKMASLIEIAMKGSSDIKLTAWHEAWHSIDEIFLTANEQKILAEKLTPDIEKQANIFAKYAADQKHLLPKSARSIFERVKAFFDKLGNYLKGRGFTNAEDVFDRALRGELKERTKRWTGEGEAALQISAMHGSPFAFDRFTTDRIGSGEGSQMFGWGLYFTDKDSIAKHYAENLGKGEIRINGRTQIQASDQLKRFVSSWLTAGNFDYVKNSLNQAINGYENAVGKEYYTLQMGHDLDVLREIKREIDKGEQSFYDNVKYKESSRNLYNVTLHKGKDPSEYHYMDWEKSIGEDVAKVIENAVGKEYLERKFFTNQNQVQEFNGATAYNFLEDYLADGNDLPGVTVEDYNYPKAVSLFLLRNGIDGIKYPAGTLSTGKTDAFNYVVFDENAVTIEDRVSFKIAPAIKKLIDSNSKKAVNPESSFQDGKEDFKRQFKEVLGKDYSNWKAHFYLPFFKGHGPNAEPMWKRAFDNTEAGREKRSDLNTHYVRKMHDFFDMPKEKVRNIEKVLVEGDAVLGQRINDLISEAITAKQGGNLELAGQLREQAKAIQLLNRYSDEELINGITLRNGEVVKLTPQEAKVYADVRTAFDQMHRDQYKHQIEMVFGKHRDKAWYSSMIDLFEDRPDSPEFTSDKKNTMKALNKLALDKIRGKKAETIQKNRAILMEVLKSHISTVSGITDQNELDSAAGDMLRAYKEEKVLMNAVKKARNRIGQQVAYFPRVREKGNVYLNIFKSETKTDKNGDEKVFKTMIHSQVVKDANEARELWAQYKSNPDHKNESLSYELGAVNKETDSTYVGVNDMNLQRVIDNAIERIRSTRNLDSGPILDSLKLSMVEAVANEMKSRGFGKSNITRRLNLIEGYKTSDLQKVALDYITGMTGMMTKQETAMNFHDILKEIPRDKPKLYNDIGKYAQDMLRNQNTFDRASGKARGITFIYYLGGNLKSALIQLTQNHVTGIPKLAEKMREWGVKGFAEAKYHKAMADASRVRVNKDTGEVTGKSINKWEARLLTEFLHRGNTADQYMQYITGRMQNELGQKFGAVMNVLSKPFGKMETFNRESASLAMFRMAWEHYSETIPDLEERYAKAYEEAREYVNFTHFAYGKENLPRVATGGDLASVTARTLLTFRSFNHNYIQSIYGSKDWKTMAHSLAYVALFGGMMGLPFVKDLFDLLEKLTGKSYTKSAREVMRKFGGRTLETFGVQGLPALAGMNISGSLAIGIPLVGETPTDTVTGVMGGMYNKAKKGIQFGAKGEWWKAGESLAPEFIASPMKAMRMSDFGKEYLGTPGFATTASGKPVFDENGKPLKMSVTDMALKTIGINPSEYSMKTEAQRSASNIEEYFSDWKTSIYETYRAGRINHDSKAISKALRQIREYNRAIVDREAMGLIPRIKMSNVVKASKMEMTKKQKREALYKRNYLAS